MAEIDLPFKVHPRVFSALGAELVTDDIVAVIELVKNSYDAFAQRVLISLEFGYKSISIIDNGSGMDRKTIEDVWCTLATPNKVNLPFSEKDNKKRRVTGAKGLGRLSAARLGGKLEMITKAMGQPAWKVSVDWELIKKAQGFELCNAHLKEYTGKLPWGDDNQTGTSVVISNLTSTWDVDMIKALRDNLGRLISPFAQTTDFEVLFSDITDDITFDAPAIEVKPYRIEPSPFLLEPKYRIKGSVDPTGGYSGKYEFRQIGSDKIDREVAITKKWVDIFREWSESEKEGHNEKSAVCGPFDFEIRVWDLDSYDTSEIAEYYQIKKKSDIRKAIAAHKGVSVYRDDILVLPKTDTARDWLRLDLRRVSRVGDRLSTSQIIGFISISADKNPDINDSSDREKLQKSTATVEFERIIHSIIHDLEQERNADRFVKNVHKEKRLVELFESFAQRDFLDRYKRLAEEGTPAIDLLPLLESEHSDWEKASEEIKRRFVYYSRLATVGSIAEMLIHEIRNNTTCIGRFLRLFTDEINECSAQLEKYHGVSENSVERLEHLSDTFSPLATRKFKRTKRNSDLQSRLDFCLELHEKEIDAKKVTITQSIPQAIILRIDPGELDAILINLITNTLYWIADSNESMRKLNISASTNGSRLEIVFDDTGPGIRDGYVDRIFEPGVTAKTNGIGMGLTVASELVSACGGRMSVIHPGTLGGATFVFDMPILEVK